MIEITNDPNRYTVVLCRRCGHEVLDGKTGDSCPICNGKMYDLRNREIVRQKRERILQHISTRSGGLG